MEKTTIEQMRETLDKFEVARARGMTTSRAAQAAGVTRSLIFRYKATLAGSRRHISDAVLKRTQARIERNINIWNAYHTNKKFSDIVGRYSISLSTVKRSIRDMSTRYILVGESSDRVASSTADASYDTMYSTVRDLYASSSLPERLGSCVIPGEMYTHGDGSVGSVRLAYTGIEPNVMVSLYAAGIVTTLDSVTQLDNDHPVREQLETLGFINKVYNSRSRGRRRTRYR